MLVGLMQWGDTYLNDGRPPLQLVDRATGHPVKAAVVTGDADELTPHDMIWKPGTTFQAISPRTRERQIDTAV